MCLKNVEAQYYPEKNSDCDVSLYPPPPGQAPRPLPEISAPCSYSRRELSPRFSRKQLQTRVRKHVAGPMSHIYIHVEGAHGKTNPHVHTHVEGPRGRASPHMHTCAQSQTHTHPQSLHKHAPNPKHTYTCLIPEHTLSTHMLSSSTTQFPHTCYFHSHVHFPHTLLVTTSLNSQQPILSLQAPSLWLQHSSGGCEEGCVVAWKQSQLRHTKG